MHIVLLNYTAPLEEIDRLMPDHMTFLNECYTRGVFVASGRRRPRTGGVILATGVSTDELTEIMALDPFVSSGSATFELVEFNVSQRQPTFAWD